jgi:hypothetical protein
LDQYVCIRCAHGSYDIELTSTCQMGKLT